MRTEFSVITTQTDERSVARWRWELELFATISGRTYLRDINRADCFDFIFFQRKDGGEIPTMPRRPFRDVALELKKFFAVCDSETRLLALEGDGITWMGQPSRQGIALFFGAHRILAKYRVEKEFGYFSQ